MGGPIALISQGRLDAVGSADDLLRRPPTVFAANFFGAVNLYKAAVEKTAGGIRASAGPIVAESQFTDGPAHLMIHPDEVVLLPATAADQANRLRGEVVALTDQGNYVAVQIRVAGLPSPLMVYVSRQLVRSYKLELGAMVAADVESAIHILRE